jgi:phytoene synthase
MRRQGQVYIPADILARNGVTRDDIVRGRGGPGVLYSLKELREIARASQEAARPARDGALGGHAAFLPVALVEPYLKRMERGREQAEIDVHRLEGALSPRRW